MIMDELKVNKLFEQVESLILRLENPKGLNQVQGNNIATQALRILKIVLRDSNRRIEALEQTMQRYFK